MKNGMFGLRMRMQVQSRSADMWGAHHSVLTIAKVKGKEISDNA